ncbi:MAG: hypothetical protein KBB14_11745 [Thermoanaerobaculia bacterium]|nr:hypothetical protein [Thermoanaerobaculia bacterium]
MAQLGPLTRRLRERDVTTKRAGVHVGTDSWFPFYAGYSQAFVRDVLSALDLSPRSTVLDPWNGAGTTSTVADDLGYSAVGIDINPVAALIASARLTRNEDSRHCAGLAREFLKIATRRPVTISPSDALLPWLSHPLAARIRSIESAILSLVGSLDGRPVNPVNQTPPPFAAFFLLALTRAAKQFIRAKPSSNPTWMQPSSRGRVRPTTLDSSFLSVLQASTGDIPSASPFHDLASRVLLGDSRSLPLSDSSVHAVITSPPYCTRLDYFNATCFELAVLGLGSDNPQHRALRASAMGTNLLREADRDVLRDLPPSVRRLLTTIRTHPSKASDSYYLRSYTQYFHDALRSLRELRRVLQPGAPAVFVVQSSYYKEVPVPLASLYVSLARHVGMQATRLHQAPVTRVLANIHRHATPLRGSRRYTEDVVLAVAPAAPSHAA